MKFLLPFILIASLPVGRIPPALQDLGNMLMQQFIDRAMGITPLASTYEPPFDTTGSVRCLVVLTETPAESLSSVPGCGDTPECQRAYFQEMFFRPPGQPPRYYKWQSVREFYQEQSCGRFDFNGDVIGPVTMPQPIDYYACGAGNGNSGCLEWDENDACLNTSPGVTPGCHVYIEDVVDAINSQVDFRDYDANNDGEVDCFIVVHPGPGAEQTCNQNLTCDPTAIWSHFWYLSSPKYTGDGSTFVYRYLIGPDWSLVWDEKIEMGVYAHEFGHYMGLVDLYDRDFTSCGLGPYSLMAYGTHGVSPNGLDPLSRDVLGWDDLIFTQDNTCEYVLYPVETSCQILVVGRDGSDDPEFFLIEYRKPIGSDVDLPYERSPDFEGGILIYHVDLSVEKMFCQVDKDIEGRCNPINYCPMRNECEWYPGKDPRYHYLIALVEASCASYDLETPSGVDVCDELSKDDHFFNDKDRNVFTPETCPNSRDYLDELGVGPFVEIRLLEDEKALLTIMGTNGNFEMPFFVNEAPSIALPGSTYEYLPEVTGTAPFTFRLLEAPAGARVDVNSGKVQWDVDESTPSGKYRFILEVSSCAGTSTKEWYVQVSRVNIESIQSSDRCFIEELLDGRDVSAYRKVKTMLSNLPGGPLVVKAYYSIISPSLKFFIHRFPFFKVPAAAVLKTGIKILNQVIKQ